MAYSDFMRQRNAPQEDFRVPQNAIRGNNGMAMIPWGQAQGNGQTMLAIQGQPQFAPQQTYNNHGYSLQDQMMGLLGGSMLSGQASFAPQMQTAMGQIGAGMQNAMSNLAAGNRWDAQFNEGNRRFNEMLPMMKSQQTADNAYRTDMLDSLLGVNGYGGAMGGKTGNSALDQLMGATHGGAQYFGAKTPGSEFSAGGGMSGWMVPAYTWQWDNATNGYKNVQTGWNPVGEDVLGAIKTGLGIGGSGATGGSSGGGGYSSGGYHQSPIGDGGRVMRGGSSGGGNTMLDQLGSLMQSGPGSPQVNLTQGGQSFGGAGMSGSGGVPYANTGISTGPGSVWGQSQASNLAGELGNLMAQGRGMLGNLSPATRSVFDTFLTNRAARVGDQIGRTGTKAEAAQQQAANEANLQGQSGLRSLIAKLYGTGLDSQTMQAALLNRAFAGMMG